MEKTIRYLVDAELMTRTNLAMLGLTDGRRRSTILSLLFLEFFPFLCLWEVLHTPQIDGWTIAFVVFLTFVVPILLLYQYVYLPRRIRNQYQMQKTIPAEYVLTVNDDQFALQSPYGRSNLPWNVFLKWREEGDYLFLYQNDNYVNFIPIQKVDAATMEFIRGKIAENRIPEKTTARFSLHPLVILTLMIITLMVFLIWSFLVSAFR